MALPSLLLLRLRRRQRFVVLIKDDRVRRVHILCWILHARLYFCFVLLWLCDLLLLFSLSLTWPGLDLDLVDI